MEYQGARGTQRAESQASDRLEYNALMQAGTSDVICRSLPKTMKLSVIFHHQIVMGQIREFFEVTPCP